MRRETSAGAVRGVPVLVGALHVPGRGPLRLRGLIVSGFPCGWFVVMPDGDAARCRRFQARLAEFFENIGQGFAHVVRILTTTRRRLGLLALQTCPASAGVIVERGAEGAAWHGVAVEIFVHLI